MNNLILSFTTIISPFVFYFFGFRLLDKKIKLTFTFKIVSTILFSIIGLGFSLWAILIYLEGLPKGIKCANGAALFFPIAFGLYLFGIPFVTFVLNKKNP